jgi:MATE family multidrug resistance protein
MRCALAKLVALGYTQRAVRSLVTRLIRLAWPVALARLGIMGMGVCDAVVVGRLAPSELPHQALGWAPTSVMLVTGIGLLTGVQVLAARALGAGAPEQAGGALQRGLFVSVLGGAASIAFAYAVGDEIYVWFGIDPALAAPAARIMRVLAWSVPLHLFYVCGAFFVEALQRPMASTWVMWAANLLNVALNLWLVPRFGAIGSAYATVGARMFLACALLAWLMKLRDARVLGLLRRTHEPSLREFLGVGVAAGVSQAAEASAFSGMTILAGRLGGHAVAGYQILLNLLAVVFMFALGFATATAVLTAEAVGRGELREARRVSWVGLAVNSAFLACIALALQLFAEPIAHAYTVDHAVAELVAALIWLVALTIVFDGGQTVVASALRAQGDNWFPTASHLLAYAVVMPVLGLMFSEHQGLGVRGLMLAIVWASVLSVGVLACRLWFLSKIHVSQT